MMKHKFCITSCITSFLLCFAQICGAAQVAGVASRFDSLIVSGTQSLGTSSAPDSKAVMDMVSTSKYVLIPRMTTTQMNAIGSPATAGLIFNTSTGYYTGYTGAAWVALVNLSGIQTLTNKSMDGGSNTFTNIGYSSLSLAGGIVNADVSSSAAIVYSKLNLTGGIVNADVNASAAIVDSKLGTISTAGKVSNSATTATNSNTNSAIVARDGSGNFSATTITAALTGTASGNTTYTANNHGVVLSGSGNAMTVVAPDASTSKTLISGGTSADPAWGTLAIGAGGTGQTTKAAAFDALQPMTTSGDIIYGGSSGTGTRLAKGSDTQVLTLVSGLPAWASAGGGSGVAAPNVVSKTSNYTALCNDYVKADFTSGTFAITIPTAIGNSGCHIWVERVDATFTPANVGTVVFTSSQSAGPFALTTLHLNTQGELWLLTSNNTNFEITNHYTATPRTTYTMTIGSTGTPPVKGAITGGGFDLAQWWRLADRMCVNYAFYQTGAGTTNSGTYLFPLPFGTMASTVKVAGTLDNLDRATRLGTGHVSSTGAGSAWTVAVLPQSTSNMYLQAPGTGLVGSVFLGLGSDQTIDFEACFAMNNWEN